MTSINHKSIGQVAKELNLSAYTLRYYEKIGLLTRVLKDSSGHRRYSQQDIDSLKFIKRAQRMHFTLSEIKTLLDIEQTNHKNKTVVQNLVSEKLDEIEVNLRELKHLKVDLTGLLNACIKSGKSEDCPIIDGLKDSN